MSKIEKKESNKIIENKEEIKDNKIDDNKNLSSLSEVNTIDILTSKGGIYIPPYRMNQIISKIREKNDKNSEVYQHVMWDLLKKSLNGIINKVNISNIQNIIIELFNENLIRGKGLLVSSITKAQMASSNLTNVYAALISVINTKLPDIGKLILTRYILSFRRAVRKLNKIQCVTTLKMIAHLINQQVNDPILAYEILLLLFENSTDDSIELACNFMSEVGSFLCDLRENSQMTNNIFERFRNILSEGKVNKRIQYSIENLFKLRKINFQGHESVIKELDLVNEEDRNIHYLTLDEEDLNPENELDFFKFDENYEKNEELYEEFKKEILGEENIIDTEKVDDLNNLIDSEQQDKNMINMDENIEIDTNNNIIDMNQDDLVKFRKTIYLTIISSIDFQECCHKLLKLDIKEGQEYEMTNMIIECCVQERTYLRFYGLLSERLCNLNEIYKKNYETEFENQYIKIHRLETNKLRNLSKLYAHLLYTNAIEWSILKIIKLTEDDTTSSSRIFIKIIFQELAEFMGLQSLNDKLQEHSYDDFSGLFCRDNPRNTRFCINFFTSIGLGALTQDLRELLNNAEKIIKEQEEKELLAIHKGKDSDEESYDSNEESESSSSSKTEKNVKIYNNHKNLRFNNKRKFRNREKFKKIKLVEKNEIEENSNSESTEKIIPIDNNIIENQFNNVNNKDYINKKRERDDKK